MLREYKHFNGVWYYYGRVLLDPRHCALSWFKITIMPQKEATPGIIKHYSG